MFGLKGLHVSLLCACNLFKSTLPVCHHTGWLGWLHGLMLHALRAYPLLAGSVQCSIQLSLELGLCWKQVILLISLGHVKRKGLVTEVFLLEAIHLLCIHGVFLIWEAFLPRGKDC